MGQLKVIGKKPNQQAIAMLETLLAQAKRGELHGIAYASIKSEGYVSTGWSGEFNSSDVFRCLGAIESLKARFIHERELATTWSQR